jgi:hypothetical protein
MNDAPRTLRDPAVLQERLSRLEEPHVQPLSQWVRRLRQRLGSDAIVPWFDPADGGVDAEILWLLEAPGPKATAGRGGSGIVSCNNNDGAAENTWRTRAEAGVDRAAVVHWNVIPYYLGDGTKIRAWEPTDVAFAGPLLGDLLGLLPRLRAVILGGKAAQVAWKDHGPREGGLVSYLSPHPSVTNLNTRPHLRAEVVAAWKKAGATASTAL